MVLNKEYVVYIKASRTGTLYIGITGFFLHASGPAQTNLSANLG